MKNIQKKLILSVLTASITLISFAQNPNLSGMDTQVKSQVTQWANCLATIFVYLGAIGAIVSLTIAAFQYYQGNDNASKTLMKGLGASIIIFLLSFIPAIFGL